MNVAPKYLVSLLLAVALTQVGRASASVFDLSLTGASSELYTLQVTAPAAGVPATAISGTVSLGALTEPILGLSSALSADNEVFVNQPFVDKFGISFTVLDDVVNIRSTATGYDETVLFSDGSTRDLGALTNVSLTLDDPPAVPEETPFFVLGAAIVTALVITSRSRRAIA
jgi:hypothetical protein